MKHWNKPSMEELNVSATAYDPEGGTRADGSYISKDRKYNLLTYGPSGGNNGTPDVDVK